MASFKIGLTDGKLYTAAELMTEASDTEVAALTLTLVENVAGDVNITGEKTDVTLRYRGSIRVLHRGGLIDDGVEFELVEDGSAAAATNIALFREKYNAAPDDTDREICCVIANGAIPPASGDTAQALASNWEVLNFTQSQPLEGAMTYRVSLKPSSFPHDYEVTTAGG